MKVLGVIPARFASTRFPGKPLIDIGGKPMIQRVYEQACLSKKLNNVVIATDDERIFSFAKSISANVVMTSTQHQNGTERTAEAANNLDEYFDVIINIQGDEPFIQPEQIDEVIAQFSNQTVEIATLKKKIENSQTLFAESIIKVVTDSEGFALYFSRSPIPFLREIPQDSWLESLSFFKHIGIYGFRKSILNSLVNLPPSALEMAEKLEQLRWLENGFKIHVSETMLESVSIDLPTDLDKIKHLI